jgi:hypothetical protein
MSRASLAIVVLVGGSALPGCSSSSEPTGPDAGAPDAGSDVSSVENPESEGGGFDAGIACVPDGGVYACLGGSWPACAGGAVTGTECPTSAASCMSCSEGAGSICMCGTGDPLGEAGATTMKWLCIGTEATCQ